MCARARKWRVCLCERASLAQVLGKLFVSRMLVHSGVLFLKDRPGDADRRAGFLVHHAIVIVAYGAGSFRGKAHFWGALSAVCETTNVCGTVEELYM